MRRSTPDLARHDQESVWAYPCPAIAQPTSAHPAVRLFGRTIVETRRGGRTIGTPHPPNHYFLPENVLADGLHAAIVSSFREWKGAASYFDVIAVGEVRREVAWSHKDPRPAFAILRDHIAFYASGVDACHVDGAEVVPQTGGFYGDWIASKVTRPFKGIGGSRRW